MEVETQLRIYGCEVIQEGGILLKLPQAVMATGQVLLHRFYVKESLLKYNIKVGSMMPFQGMKHMFCAERQGCLSLVILPRMVSNLFQREKC